MSPGLREFFPSIEERAALAQGYVAAPFSDSVISVTSCPLKHVKISVTYPQHLLLI